MIRRFARTFSLLTNLGFFCLALAAALPGTHRVFFPASFGLTEISDRVWTDAPARATEMLALVDQARARVARFFRDAPPNPTIVLCSTRTCARDFGIGGNGLSVADMVVMVGPGGLTLGTLAHEMTHSRLHRNMGLRNIVAQPFPTWFDEGLATHVANHPDWNGRVTAAARTRVREVGHFWQWDDAYRELGVGQAYAAAAAEVAGIEARAGRDGLLELIARADAGESFDGVLIELFTR